MGEDICKACGQKDSSPKYTNSAFSTVSKSKQPNQKMDRRTTYTFPPQRKMTSMHTKRSLDYWRKANQKFNEVSPHTSHNDHLQLSPAINPGEGVERRS